MLNGPEVKMVRQGRIDLNEAFVRFVGYGPFLVNALIPPYQVANQPGYDQRRSRKLLLHKHQIESLLGKIGHKGLTLVPLACYTSGNLIKLEIGLAQAKKQFDKRQALRQRDLDRQVQQELRGKD